eukprot:TRINITY_DN42637_c0_g1_i1.p1 TRINITY_DN42637_c0_g1~~TRINITY_DN42637_c0_g1_i1.p1  ORF type:complete len:188 (-),score=31.61 TRINITY_DN42637_c0_g1_i1:126-689(-)
MEVIECSDCHRTFGTPKNILSDKYVVKGGPALLMREFDLSGTVEGNFETRQLISGNFDICWLSCVCSQDLGFVYKRSHSEALKYKEGHVVVSKSSIQVVVKQPAAETAPMVAPTPSPTPSPVVPPPVKHAPLVVAAETQPAAPSLQDSLVIVDAAGSPLGSPRRDETDDFVFVDDPVIALEDGEGSL